MLIPGLPASIVVCSSCRGPDGRAGGGERLAAALAATGSPVETMACLWACGSGAVVHLRGPGKISYLLGMLDVADAPAVGAFAAAHAASADGAVAFDRWPAGVLGHFIARIPPPGMLVD